MLRALISLTVIVLTTSPLFAGAPLKGVDVKLGRPPGGTVAARTTGGDGSFDFGILPKGIYFITLDGSAGTAVIVLKGVPGGALRKSLAIAKGVRQRGSRRALLHDWNSPRTATILFVAI